ncbi:MAG: transaldolase [Actinomycetes bacterium]
MTGERLRALAERGQAVWLDSLSRDLVRGGGLRLAMEEDAVSGVTSNPTIFQRAIASTDAYDAEIHALAAAGLDATSTFFALAVVDVQEACDLFRPVWELTGGNDGFISLEVDPRLAYDADATVGQAVELHAAVDRANLLVKIPATEAGLPAIEHCIAAGISVNVTLIFSLARYRAVIEAYLCGLERLVERGGDPAAVRSVASFFVSRLDTEVDRLLARHHEPALLGQVGVANARLAYASFQETFASQRFARLASSGAATQKPVWASVSTKNPAYRDTMYVEELIGPDTVNTMPPETVQAFRDHGEVRGDTVLEGVETARAVLELLAAMGVDYDVIVADLETEGVRRFVDSFDELLVGIETKSAGPAPVR